MVKVAVAGGTGGVGRAVVETLIKQKEHEVYVLSRRTSTVFANESAVHLLSVDYTSVPALTSALKDNGIAVVLSTLNMVYPDSSSAQLNLIEAAEASGTVTRFAPSEFGADYEKAAKVLGRPMPFSEGKLAALSKLRGSKLEYTRFITGTFMEYYAPAAPTYLSTSMAFFVDPETMTAAIPGDGNVKVPTTYSFDVAAFVAAALRLPKWPDASYIAGDKLTFNELVKVVEEVRGAKMEVTYDPVEGLRKGEVTMLEKNKKLQDIVPLEAMVGMFCTFGEAMAIGVMDFNVDSEKEWDLAEKIPEVKATGVRAFLEKYWEKK